VMVERAERTAGDGERGDDNKPQDAQERKTRRR
jgi:hypothetical protein